MLNDETLAGNFETRNSSNLVIAYGLFRLHLGVNIAIHGISRLMVPPDAFVARLAQQFSATILSGTLVYGFARALPFLETVIGLLILFGIKTKWALIGGALLMIVLTFGSTLTNDFQAAGLQLSYAIAYFILISFLRFNNWSVDHMFSQNK